MWFTQLSLPLCLATPVGWDHPSHFQDLNSKFPPFFRFFVLPSALTMTTSCRVAVMVVLRLGNDNSNFVTDSTGHEISWFQWVMMTCVIISLSKVWEVATKQCLHTFTDHSDQVIAHCSSVLSAHLSVFILIQCRCGVWSTTRRATRSSLSATTNPSTSTQYLFEIHSETHFEIHTWNTLGKTT